MEWRGEAWLEQAKKRVGRAVEASAIDLQNDIRVSLSVAGRTVSFAQAKNGKQRKVVGAMGSNPSRPGEAPHKQTGQLRSSIAHAMSDDGLKARVGSALRTAKFLELGVRGGKIIRPKTKKALAFNGIVRKSVRQGPIAPRPFLRPALKRKEQSIRQRIGASIGAKTI